MNRLTYLKKHRLNPSEIEQVFKKNDKFSTKYLFFLFRKNEVSLPRLCCIVAKNKTQSAVQRNLIRRLTKEFFRLNQYEIPSYDIVLLTTPKTKLASKEDLSACIAQYFEFLKKS